jgi:hypothetical protein
MADDLRTRLLERIGIGSLDDTALMNPDGPEAVAALDERDARIKALEAGLERLVQEADACDPWYESEPGRLQNLVNEARNLLTNPTPAKE